MVPPRRDRITSRGAPSSPPRAPWWPSPPRRGPAGSRPLPPPRQSSSGSTRTTPPRACPRCAARPAPRATKVISTYVTGGRLVEPQVVALAKRSGARLLVSWMPDGGKQSAGARQPRFRLGAIRRGRQNRGLVRLTKQLRKLRPAPILRPMPEPNTPWYAWSGSVNGNAPADYAKAWAKVRQVVRNSGGKRIKLMWAPYVRSIPDTPENAIAAYFPGADTGRSRRGQRIQLRPDRRPRLDRAHGPLRGRLPPGLRALGEALLDRRDRLDQQGRQQGAVDRPAGRAAERDPEPAAASSGTTPATPTATSGSGPSPRARPSRASRERTAR